jgi:hypothetical protein
MFDNRLAGLSSGRYKQFHVPLTLTEISSRRQLWPTGLFRRWNCAFNLKVYVSTQK